MSKSEHITQNKKILRYLETHKRGITSFEAFAKFGITRLSGRIFELRESGYQIKTSLIQTKNEDGNNVRYARYTLCE